MEQHTPREETRRIINGMVKKRGVFVKANADMLTCMLRREKRRMKSYSIIRVFGKDTISFPFCVHLVLLWIFFEALKWICSAFEESSKVMRIYTLLASEERNRKRMIPLVANEYIIWRPCEQIA